MRLPFLLLTLLGLAGCRREPAAVETSPAAAPATAEVAPAAPDVAAPSLTGEVRWYPCEPGRATKSVVAEVTIPSVWERSKHQMFIRPDTPFDEEGLAKFHHPPAIMLTTACQPGTFHESVHLARHEPDSRHVVLRLHYMWRQFNQRSGGFDEEIPLEVDKPIHIALTNGAFVDVSWHNVGK